MRVSGTADLLCRKCFLHSNSRLLCKAVIDISFKEHRSESARRGWRTWAGQGGSRPGFCPGLSSAAAGCTSGHCPSGRWPALSGNRLRSVRPGVVRDGPAHRPAPLRLNPRGRAPKPSFLLRNSRFHRPVLLQTTAIGFSLFRWSSLQCGGLWIPTSRLPRSTQGCLTNKLQP